ncbi:hypothetical protein H6G06_09955 [Anabaena sphaerica FACHB-251]|uniref:Uncharacterized protein n=1 Tax=Anabaena sphaerica FACHB-251 TaxID=2692883 RepID=A0A926WG24_9NOST|nr:hypothetical protein [Anabaena sphaerica]MBD2293808.1 hypothetical protein [Anabaena sphaerica FACHB-251]
MKVYNLEFLTALLNFKLLDWRFNLTSTNNNINGYEIKSLPVPKIFFTTPPEKRQEYLQNLINIYQQYQINHNPNILLTQIDHHLNQQPSQADVIHDLLAYLAE